jgi:type I restriction enzyme S subunit
VSLQTFFDNFALLADAPNGVQKVRELILNLAMQGKLVPQDSHDEPASVLLEKLKQVKANSNNGKKSKKKEALPSIEDNETPFTLPNGWQWGRFFDVATIASNLVQPKDYLDYPHVAPDNIEKFTGRLLPYRSVRDDKVSSANHKFFNGQIVYSKIRPNLAKAVIVDFDGLCSADMYPINSHIYSPFLLQYMLSKTFLSMAVKTDTRVAMPKINQEELNKILVPVPPLEEQKRIVAKIEELMCLCDELEAHQQARRSSQVRLNNATLAPLNNAASLAPAEFEQASARLADNFAALYDSAETVGRLRSTILQLAVQGKLAMQDSQDEPASVLLERIEEEREANKEKQKKKRIEFPSLSLDDGPFTIPSKWLWTHLGQLAMLIEYGTSEKASLDNKGVPVFRMNNIEGGTVLHSNLKYVSPTIKDLPRLYLQYNELLFNRTNSIELVGKTGIFKGESDKFTFASYLIRIRVFDSHIFPDYINLAMNAAYFRETQINPEVTQQCGQANFNGTKLAYTLIPLPPLEEQKRIVAKVNLLMALCDELEDKLRRTEEDSEKLMKVAAQHVLTVISQESQDETLSVRA